MQSKKYPLPDFLIGVVSVATYEKWLEKRGNQVLKRDLGRRKPFAVSASVAMYKEIIHAAVTKSGEFDPYTGEKLDWTLIGKWDTNTKLALVRRPLKAFDKQFYLLPTVDHTFPDADTLDLEICSWLVNTCKNLLDPADFVALCQKVVAHRGNTPKTKKRKIMRT